MLAFLKGEFVRRSALAAVLQASAIVVDFKTIHDHSLTEINLCGECEVHSGARFGIIEFQRVGLWKGRCRRTEQRGLVEQAHH